MKSADSFVKIQNIKTFRVPPRWLFLKIETDKGISGWGEPIVEGKASTVEAAIHECKDLFLGENALNTERIWQTLYRGNFYRGGPVLMSMISGIDQALWDIKGKYYGAPVHDLLGGACRDKIRMYTWIGGDNPYSLEKTAEEALQAKQAGFSAIKMNACGVLGFIDTVAQVNKIIDRIAAVRQTVGNDFDIAVDFHGRVHKAMAKILLKESEPFHLLFAEEPVLPEHLLVLPQISAFSSTPIATGERLFTRYEFRQLLENGYVNVVQPDISHAGGISECLRIANMAEAYDVQLALHCPLGPIALMSALHVDAVAYNFLIQEQSMGIHYNKEAGSDVLDYLNNPEILKIENGFIKTPQRPGLGLDINEKYVEQQSKNPKAWKNPVWHYEDGNIAEW